MDLPSFTVLLVYRLYANLDPTIKKMKGKIKNIRYLKKKQGVNVDFYEKNVKNTTNDTLK
jgi:hypothetical protein